MYATPVLGPPLFDGVSPPAVSGTVDEALDPVVLPVAHGGKSPVAYSLSPSLPTGLSFDADTRTLSGTPAEPTDATWTLTATDSLDETGTLSFAIHIESGAPAPLSYEGVPAPNVSAQVGVPLTAVDLPAANGGSLPVTYSLSPALPEGLAFDASARTVSGTPSEVADAMWTLTATDAGGATATLSVSVQVGAAVGPPTFGNVDAPSISVVAGEAMEPVTLPAVSGGSGTLSYSLTPALPDGLSFEATTRVLAGTPASVADEGTWTLTATDEAEASATLAVTIEILAPAAGPPSFEGVDAPAVSVTAGESMAPVTLPAASGGSGTVSYALAPQLPAGLAFEATTRAVSGTPQVAAETASWTLTATDENEASATLTVTITVTAPGTPPSYAGIDSPALEFLEGSALDPVTLPAATGGNGALTYALAADLGNGLDFEAATRVISGTPAAPAATTTHTLTATDADGDTATLAFTLVVKEDLQPTYARHRQSGTGVHRRRSHRPGDATSRHRQRRRAHLHRVVRPSPPGWPSTRPRARSAAPRKPKQTVPPGHSRRQTRTTTPPNSPLPSPWPRHRPRARRVWRSSPQPKPPGRRWTWPSMPHPRGPPGCQPRARSGSWA